MVRLIAPVLTCFLIISCAAEYELKGPPNPENTWVEGNWISPGGWDQKMDLKVGDGNKIVGSFENRNPSSGNKYYGIISGTVEDSRVKLTVTMTQSGNKYEYDLIHGKDLLSGSAYGGHITFIRE